MKGSPMEGSTDHTLFESGDAVPDPDAMKVWQALDLSDRSALCTELMEGLEREQSDQGRVELTDELGTYPQGLTPEMLSWFQSRIQPIRTAALQHLRSGFAAATLGKTAVGRGTLVEMERARNQHDRLLTYHRIHSDLRRNHHDLLAERDARQREFEEARAEHGNRDPVMTNPWLYWGGLITVVGIEIAINFDSLMKLPMIKSGMFAVGMAILVGLAVGFAAHVHGTILKQWHYWFNSFDRTRVWKATRKLGIGAGLLTLALGLIGWSRMFYVMPLIELAEVTGETPPSMIFSIMFMTLSNIIVYGVGVIWAYFHHDEDPDYPPKKVRVDQAQAAAMVETRKINTRLKEADDKAAHREKELDALEKAQKASVSWEANSKALAAFRAVDHKVAAALHRYRTALVKQMQGEGTSPKFVQPVVTRDDAAREEVLTGAAYLGRPITLKLL